jgi:hypothetical protein
MILYKIQNPPPDPSHNLLHNMHNMHNIEFESVPIELAGEIEPVIFFAVRTR